MKECVRQFVGDEDWAVNWKSGNPNDYRGRLFADRYASIWKGLRRCKQILRTKEVKKNAGAMLWYYIQRCMKENADSDPEIVAAIERTHSSRFESKCAPVKEPPELTDEQCLEAARESASQAEESGIPALLTDRQRKLLKEAGEQYSKISQASELSPDTREHRARQA